MRVPSCADCVRENWAEEWIVTRLRIEPLHQSAIWRRDQLSLACVGGQGGFVGNQDTAATTLDWL